VELTSGDERFTVDDLYTLTELVAAAWTAGADRDWSVPAGTVEWSCTKTADHAVDCVYAPEFFLASRKQDAYPNAVTRTRPERRPVGRPAPCLCSRTRASLNRTRVRFTRFHVYQAGA
jgi:hypothetical protein